jgi:hypothetical protein
LQLLELVQTDLFAAADYNPLEDPFGAGDTYELVGPAVGTPPEIEDVDAELSEASDGMDGSFAVCGDLAPLQQFAEDELQTGKEFEEGKLALEAQLDRVISEGPEAFPWFVSITRKRSCRKLHITGSPSCPVLPGATVQDYLLIEKLEDAEYDDYCRSCWRHGARPGTREATLSLIVGHSVQPSSSSCEIERPVAAPIWAGDSDSDDSSSTVSEAATSTGERGQRA